MRMVFADLFYYFALLNDRDPAHEKAMTFVRSFHGRMVTTGWILTELGDGLASPANRPAFLATLETVQGDPNTAVVGCSEELLEVGVDLFRRHADKYWSLTDCISFVVMQREGISEALTGDKHFE